MNTLVLPDIPDDLYQRLSDTAAAHRRSVAQEVLALLRDRLPPEPPATPKPTWEEFAGEMRDFWGRLPTDPRTADEILGYDEHGLPRWFSGGHQRHGRDSAR
ncbi:FitA-like ribbon-helix-helix domain-containing protein [Methylomagnum sp.]